MRPSLPTSRQHAAAASDPVWSSAIRVPSNLSREQGGLRWSLTSSIATHGPANGRSTRCPGRGAKLDADTPCDEWDVRTLMNHMLDTSSYFVGSAAGRGRLAAVADPARAARRRSGRRLRAGRDETMAHVRRQGVIEKTGPSLGIAFSDQLLHGWDLAKATGQDATMPAACPRRRTR